MTDAYKAKRGNKTVTNEELQERRDLVISLEDAEKAKHARADLIMAIAVELETLAGHGFQQKRKWLRRYVCDLLDLVISLETAENRNQHAGLKP